MIPSPGEERTHFGYDPIRDRYLDKNKDKKYQKQKKKAQLKEVKTNTGKGPIETLKNFIKGKKDSKLMYDPITNRMLPFTQDELNSVDPYRIKDTVAEIIAKSAIAETFTLTDLTHESFRQLVDYYVAAPENKKPTQNDLIDYLMDKVDTLGEEKED